MLENISYLDIRYNQIEILRQVELLISKKWLNTFKMEGNPASLKPFYRERVIYRLMNLTKLDDITVSADEKIRSQNLYEANGGDLEMRKQVFYSIFPNDEFALKTPEFQDDEIDIIIQPNDEVVVEATSD